MIAFDARLARPDFRLDVAFEAGREVTALFGPSGSGKSSVIRLLAGLDRPDDGRIVLDGTTLVDTAAGVFVPPHLRRVGLVFQDALLLPHLSVRANLTYGRWFTRADERRLALDPVVAVLGIGHLLDRRPDTLSGGERQRVAIGRALLTSPRLLLMDEPLSALDQARKQEILPFIERLRDEFAIPIVYVSHAAEEVARLANRVIRLDHGRVTAAGDAASVLGRAPSGDGAGRFEAVSVLTGRVVRYLDSYDVTLLAHPAGEIVVPGRVAEDGPVRVLVRATSVTLAVGRPGQVSVRTVLTGTISEIAADDGPFVLARVTLAGGDTLQVSATRLAMDDLALDVGDTVTALVKAAAIDERGVPAARHDG